MAEIEIHELETPSELSPEGLEPVECLNCGNVSVGDFCNMCGQAADTERFAFGSLIRELYNTIRRVDVTATFATCLQLFRRPGEFLIDYLAGRRVGYINPVKFFFYSIIADILIRQLLQWLTGDQSFAAGITTDTRIQILGACTTVLWGLAWRLFYWNKELNLAEFAVCALFFESQTNFAGTLILVLTAPIREYMPSSGSIILISELLLTWCYGIYFSYQLFKEPAWKVGIKQTVLIIFYIALLVAMFRAETAAIPK